MLDFTDASVIVYHVSKYDASSSVTPIAHQFLLGDLLLCMDSLIGSVIPLPLCSSIGAGIRNFTTILSN